MGIHLLNAYIKKTVTSESITKISLSDLAYKVIVIDISIYLYRFLAEGELIENIYFMISLFRYYNIIPIVVFDGKSPPEKQQLLDKRNNDKKNAEFKYNELQELLLVCNDKTTKNEIKINLQNLKRKFIRLKKSDILIVQQLLTAYGIQYFEAEGEADILCAKLVIKRYAYACLSEDMDLFVYGCPRILRYFSLINQTVVIYYLDQILKELNLTFNEFKEICVLSGTDYEYTKKYPINIKQSFLYFKQYKDYCLTNPQKLLDFYDWVKNTYNCIDNIYKLYNICNMFRTDNITIPRFIQNKKLINTSEIKKILEPRGFIFV